MSSALPLLRLLQVTDSSFPVGGFAFSHGLEWLAQAGWVRDEEEVAAAVDAYLVQGGGGQWLPAALAAYQARTMPAVCRIDDRLDASIAVAGEREAGRAMGERLLVGAMDAFGGERTATLIEAVHSRGQPGQYAAAYGVVAGEAGVEPGAMLAALGSTMVNSVAQAAVRLGCIGQSAAIRITAGAAPRLSAVVDSTLSRRPPRTFGAFAPGLDTAGMLHPSLPFRMFAS